MIRNKYEELGVEGFYKKEGSTYRNPHEKIIEKLISIANEKNLIGDSVIDLCCGSGEITVLMEEKTVIGIDPFTNAAYSKRTGKNSLNYSFKDIAKGNLKITCDTIICSFALHLCPPSLLHNVLWNLKDVSRRLIVISPNKKPDCHGIAGWLRKELIEIDRVKMNFYENSIIL